MIALAIAWTLAPLASVFDPHALAAFRALARDRPAAPLVVVLVFVAAGLVATPATLLIGATVLLFGAARGASYAFAGMMTSAIVFYAVGRFALRAPVDDWLATRAPSSFEAFNRRLAGHGFLAAVLARLTPVPFSLSSGVMGASRIGFQDFVLGTAIGIVPVIVLMAGLATQVDAWLERPDSTRLVLLIGAAAGVVLAGWLLGRFARRRASGHTADTDDASP